MQPDSHRANGMERLLLNIRKFNTNAEFLWAIHQKNAKGDKTE